MTDFHHQQTGGHYGGAGAWQQSHYQRGGGQPTAHLLAKTATAVTVGGALLLLSALTATATVVGLTIITPLLVIFSPVIVPAAIATVLLLTGFVASGAFGLVAVGVLVWMYRYVSGGHPVGADQLDHARAKVAGKAQDWRERVDGAVHQRT